MMDDRHTCNRWKIYDFIDRYDDDDEYSDE